MIFIRSIDFIEYLEDNCIGRRIRNNRRRLARFPISFWNCFSRLDNHLSRTNNGQECWHHSLQVMYLFNSFFCQCNIVALFQISMHKSPSIYESITDLQIEQYANLIFA